GTSQKSAELFGFATIRTDQADYSPGTTVTITGSGWQPFESVALVLLEYPLLDTHPLHDATADANGNIVNTEFSPDAHDVDVRFYLTAYGTASQAQTTFTDAIASSTALSSSLNPSTFGQSVMFTATVTCNSCNFTSAQTVAFVENANSNSTGGGTTTLSSGNAISISNNLTPAATAVATFSTSTLSVGTHSIRACFTGGGGSGSNPSN